MSKIYVSNLSWNPTDDSLKNAFSEFGQVVDSIVMRDRDTGRSRGFGFVTFNAAEEAQAAINRLNDQELDRRGLEVDLANALEREREREQRQWEHLVRRAQLLQQLEAPPGACTGGLSPNHLSSLLFLLVLAALAHELVGWFLFLGLLVTILAYLLLIIPQASPSTVWPCRVHRGSSASRRGFSVAHYPACVSGNCRPIHPSRWVFWAATRRWRFYVAHNPLSPSPRSCYNRSQGDKMCSPGSLCTGFTRKIQAPNGS